MKTRHTSSKARSPVASVIIGSLILSVSFITTSLVIAIIAYNTTDATIEWETNLGLSYPQYRTATPVYSNGVIYLVGHAYVNSVTSKIYAVDAVSGEIRWVKEVLHQNQQLLKFYKVIQEKDL